MTLYAQNTSVSVEASEAEIKRTLTRYGATGYMSGFQGSQNIVAFELNARRVKFVLVLPDRDAEEFQHTPGGRRRRDREAAYKAWEQACRASWRALALVIKAKLEAVETGITCFEDEFMAHIVLPNGRTVGEWMQPQIEAAYSHGKMPPLLPMPKEKP